MEELAVEEFEQLVEQALAGLPGELAARLSNVGIFVEDRNDEDPELLGLYEGVPLTERAEFYFGVLPDRVTIYRLPLCEMCADRDEIVHEVRVTLVHEIAHHFGIDDDRLDELGYA